MPISKYKILISLLGLLLGISVQGQETGPEILQQYLKAYPDEDAVYLSLQRDIAIDLQGDGKININADNHSSMLFLSDQGHNLAEETVSYSGFREITSIQARTLVPSNRKFKTIEVKDFKDADAMSGGVFYDDRREKSFIFPAVSKGAIAELDYSEQINEPRFLGTFYFNSYVPVVESGFSITCPEGVSLRFLLRGDDTSGIHFAKTEADGQTIYKWTAEKMAKMAFEPNAPSLNYFEPHLIVFIDRVEGAEGSTTVLSDVSSLYAWYRELTRDLNQEPDSALISLVDNLTANTTDTEDKIRAIYYWVQDQIKYIAFEDGLGGFIPRQAAEVCTRKYGDCKDMASLTTEMLNIAGIPTDLTWIGTRDIPYDYEDVPTPMVDNHMIASVEMGEDRLFLDATSEYLPLGYPSSFVQGKQALIGKGDDFELVRVPVVPMTQNGVSIELECAVEGNLVKGVGVQIMKGYPHFRTVMRMQQVRESRIKNWLTGVLGIGNNKFELGDYKVSGREERDSALQFEFSFQIPDYVRKIGDDIYVNMQLDRRYQTESIDTQKRTRPVEFDFKRMDEVFLSVPIPSGYQLSYLPSNSSFTGKYFGFETSYVVEANTIRLHQSWYIDELMLTVNQFEEWNQMIIQLNEAYQEVVSFSKIDVQSE